MTRDPSPSPWTTLTYSARCGVGGRSGLHCRLHAIHPRQGHSARLPELAFDGLRRMARGRWTRAWSFILALCARWKTTFKCPALVPPGGRLGNCTVVMGVRCEFLRGTTLLERQGETYRGMMYCRADFESVKTLEVIIETAVTIIHVLSDFFVV